QGAAHLRFDGTDGTAAYEGDLFVSQVGVLAKKKNFFLLGPQAKDGLPQTFLRFLSFQGLGRGGLFTEKHSFTPAELASPAMPGATLGIAGDVQADPEDPGGQIPHLDYSGLAPPALEKGILHGILGGVRVAQQGP